jgi:FkbM family methyltransferase
MDKLLFDIGANRGDAVLAGLQQGYKVIALEPAPKIYSELVKNFIYNPNVVPLRFAASDSNNERIEFYECIEDGLSTMEKAWLTDPRMPYNGKEFRTISVSTCTVDWLVETYGAPDLIKIDVEGAEWSVFKGMTKRYGTLVFEWTQETLREHQEQLMYLRDLGYKNYKMQFIEGHLDEPQNTPWKRLNHEIDLVREREQRSEWWETSGWKKAGLRPTADVGMLWVQ